MTFWNTSGYRIILDTETDSSSPVSEEVMSQFRENLEALFINLHAAESSGVASKNPSSGTTGLFYANKSWTSGFHNYRYLFILSGAAKGNKYKIWRTLTASSAISSSGNNLYADGIRSGDRFRIFYSYVGSSDAPNFGHNHDGINSRSAAVESSAITSAMIQTSAITTKKLRTKTGSISKTDVNAKNMVLPGGEYGFYPQIKTSTDISGIGDGIQLYTNVGTTWRLPNYVTNVGLSGTTIGTYYVQQRYISS